MSSSSPCVAVYFDGQSSRRHPVELAAEAGVLQVAGLAEIRRVPLAAIRVSEPQGRAPRTLRFGDGAYCEVEQGEALLDLLDALGYRESGVVRLQGRWRWSVMALAMVVMLLAAGYQWGLPWGAKQIAPRIPVSTMAQLSDGVLETLDKHMLSPSSLSPGRQQDLQRGFQRLAESDPELAAYGARLQLLFRRAKRVRGASGIGPNAFALPGGQVVLLDELVALKDISDDEILAVLAHELGHVRQRHGMQQLIQSSVAAAVTAAYLGDVSIAVSGLAALALESAYSRDMEREADAYAAATLLRLNANPEDLASALEKLEAFYAGKEKSAKEEEPGKYTGWLDSHPDTRERVMRIRRQHGGK
ncbi:MAG: M48 family metallopeptidase [Zoogloeaceae bacterium]|jgi:Zn-dependent protease with chaperone function|nr:M48 family metallopeptidase [Zoogloeaceae bacterium]